ncbi:MAG: hypothetical protein JST50_01015 [Bacteroidetes bacterium]|jgi:hypothetical protein|nr:hypothetical protein [Bacteroidota bacterium]
MSLFPQIQITNQVSATDNGIIYTNGDVYIIITDENNNPANGNNMTVTVAFYDTGNTNNHDFIIPGQSLLIYSGILSRKQASDGTVIDIRNFTVVDSAEGTPSPPTVCDAAINAIITDKKESAPGAADGQITINASSGYGPIQYSLDAITYQSSPIFTGLTGGSYTAYIRDANSCTAFKQFTLLTVSNLLIGDPSVDLGNGNISRWNAAFNPIVFTYQRKDFEVTGITQDSQTQKAQLNINATVIGTKPNEMIYVNAGAYNGIYQVYQVQYNSLIIDTPYVSSSTTGGYVNINSLRPYYKMRTQITYQDKLTGQQQTIQATNRPDSKGIIRADFSNFLQSLLRAKDESTFTRTNFRDDNLSASYQIQYAESWYDGTPDGYTSSYIPISDPYYVIYAAKQLGTKYGGNLAAYIPFASLTDNTQLAKWITDFAEPAYSNGYPFDIGFIYSENLLGLNIYCEVTLLDINRNPLPGDVQANFLLNEDSSWLLNQDSSKLIISGQTISTTPLPVQLGLNRLMINGNFPDEARYITVSLKYDDENGTTHAITQTQTIRIDDAVDERSVYLRWIGLSGSWEYYRFVYNQEVSLDVQNATIIKNFVYDWENQDSIEEVISKDAGQKMKVMAEDLSVNDIKGLQSIKYSPKVQMLVNKNPVKWQTIVINTATYSEYETMNGQAPFSITFNMPSINIQTQ